MLLEMKQPLPLVLFVLSIALIVVCDTFMVKKLGENPLQGELAFLEKESIRLKKLENKAKTSLRNINASSRKIIEPASKNSHVFIAISLGILMIFTFITIGVMDRFKVKEAQMDLRSEKLGKDQENIPPPQIESPVTNFVFSRGGGAAILAGLGLVLLVSGYLQSRQGLEGSEQLKPSVEQILSIRREEDTRKPWQKKLDREILMEYYMEKDRNTRGRTFLFLGGLVFVLSVGAIQIFYLKDPK